MKLFDFRTTDLIDKLDWNDPRFLNTVAMLASISEVFMRKEGQRLARYHVINIRGTEALFYDATVEEIVKKGLSRDA